MRVHLCGVRGSTPAPGADFVRYGGHTSCVAVSTGDGLPSLVLDAGTGLRRLSPILGDEPFRGTILLSHLHWDHTHGLPFFRAGDHPGSSVSLLLPEQGADVLDVLDRGMSPPHFPIRLTELQGSWTFGSLSPGGHGIDGFTLLALDVPHKGGRTFGYRVDDGRASLAYVSDHSPLTLGDGPGGVGEYHEAVCRLAEGVDLLIHDAQYTSEELLTTRRRHFGHSAVDYAVELGRRSQARRVLLFHHDPARTDSQIDDLAAAWRRLEIPVEAAAEGAVVDLSPGRASG